MRIKFCEKIVEFYPYRTAKVLYTFCEDCSASSEQSFWLVEQIKRYVEENGYKMGNHICWKTESGLCYQYSDHSLLIGTELIKDNW